MGVSILNVGLKRGTEKWLQRQGDESVKPSNQYDNGAMWASHQTTVNGKSNYHWYGLSNVCNGVLQYHFQSVVTFSGSSLDGFLSENVQQHILLHSLAAKQSIETKIVSFESTHQDLYNKGGPATIGYQHKCVIWNHR